MPSIHQRHRRTDRQTDRRTDGRLRIAIPRWHYVHRAVKTKLQLFIHICRMPIYRLLKPVMFGMVERERRQRRPVQKLIDDILK